MLTTVLESGKARRADRFLITTEVTENTEETPKIQNKQGLSRDLISSESSVTSVVKSTRPYHNRSAHELPTNKPVDARL